MTVPDLREFGWLEARRESREDLLHVTHALIEEFDGVLPAGTVIRQITRAREHLIGAGVRHGLVPAAEAMARFRLNGLVPAGAGFPGAGGNRGRGLADRPRPDGRGQ